MLPADCQGGGKGVGWGKGRQVEAILGGEGYKGNICQDQFTR